MGIGSVIKGECAHTPVMLFAAVADQIDHDGKEDPEAQNGRSDCPKAVGLSSEFFDHDITWG